MTDFHTHSLFSGDADDTLENMVRAAIRAGCRYLCPTEHCNLDFARNRIDIEPSDLDGYAAEFARLRTKYAGQIRLTYGIELGYDMHCKSDYADIVKKYRFEYVINSTHLIDGEDCYHGYFDRYDVKTAFTNYLKAVRDSLDAPYRFDTVGHFGYVARNCPYENVDMYTAAPDLADDILKTMISRGVCLEANSSVRRAPQPCLPAANVLKRYRELGGESIVFGSDAHRTGDLFRSRSAVIEHLRNVGFKYHTVWDEGKKIQLKIEN
ncbi:phosphoesterase [Clostridia bacterium]|nr:phosphoesterase [Clostridia bacterium]